MDRSRRRVAIGVYATADNAATTAMRAMFDSVNMRGEVVIGEGEMDEAPMLYIGEKLLEVAGGEVANMQDLSILLCRKTAIERIASFLLTMAGKSAGPLVGRQLPLPMCRADIADYLGLTIETVSRNMTRLKAMRVIDLPNRGSFVVRDIDRLRLLAQCEGNMH